MKTFHSGFHLSVDLPIRVGQQAKLRKGALFIQNNEILVAEQDRWVFVKWITPGYSIFVGKQPVDAGIKPLFHELTKIEKERVLKAYGTSFLPDLLPVLMIKGSGLYLPISNPMVSWDRGCEADINEFVF